MIQRRLNEFKSSKTNDDIASELCFCLLTPQSKARVCDEAVKRLSFKEKDPKKIAPHLKGVRFANNKSRYIAEAMAYFYRNPEMTDIIKGDQKEAREWLVRNIKGFGYKEASHFLRNVGNGDSIAILDRHILKNLVKHKAIKEIPKTLTRKRYMEIEQKMKTFSERVGIPMDELDLLFWSEETGEVFK